MGRTISPHKSVSLDSKYSDMEFVKNFTPPDFQAKNFTPSISPNFNSFSKKKHKKWVKMEKFTPLAKILHCRRHWRHWQIPPLSKSSLALSLRKHPSLPLLLFSLRSSHWGSSAVARWRKSPSTLLLPLSTKSSRTASLRCVWCQHDSDLDCLAVGVAYLRCSIKLWLVNWRVPALIVTHSFSTNLSN